MEWIEKSCNKRTRAKSTGWQSLNLIHPYIWKRSKPQWTSEHSEVAQLCPTLCYPMEYGIPGSTVHGILQARILEWAAISFSRGSSQPRDRTWVFCIADRRFTVWATRVILLIEEKLITKKVRKLSYVSTTSDSIHEHSTMPFTRILRVDAGCWELSRYCQPESRSLFNFVQFSSVAQSCLTFCNPTDCSMPGFLVHHQLPKLAQTHVHKSVMPSSNLILCLPLLLLPSIFSSTRVFSSESVLHIRWPEYWGFSFSISPQGRIL